jgi:sulfite exporter TauE/SafE
MDLILTPLAGLGLLWTLVHCAGMCGPVVAASGAGRDAAGGFSTGRLVFDLAVAQWVRACLLAALGAAAGALGAAVADELVWLTRVLGVVVAAALFASAAAQLGWLRLPGGAFGAGLLARVVALRARRPLAAMALLGVVVALMPCAITGWALAIAAAMADPLHGAAGMVVLVAVSTLGLVPGALAFRRVALAAPVLARLVPALAMAGAAAFVLWRALAPADLGGLCHV